MKKLLFPILFLVSITTIAQTFTKLNNIPFNGQLTWVFATSTDDAFVTAFETNSLFTTHDGGTTWNTIVLNNELMNLTDVYFTDAMNGWVTGSENDSGESKLFKTIDGGLTWEDVSENIPVNQGLRSRLSAIRMNGDNGVIGVSNGLSNATPLYYTTTDGGDSWTPHNNLPGNLEDRRLVEITRISNNPQTGTFQLTGTVNDNRAITIYNSTNNGASFQLVYSETAIFGQPFNTPLDIFNSNGTVYWIPQLKPRKSTNGGASFSAIQYPDNGPLINSGFFDSPEVGYIVGESSAIYRTDDGGDNWTTLQLETTGPGEVLRSVFKFENVIWVVGHNGTVYKSEDAVLSTENISDATKINVYPNPTSDNLFIDGIESSAIKIYNILGQDISATITTSQISSKKLKLDLNNIKSGIYFIKTENATYKFLKD